MVVNAAVSAVPVRTAGLLLSSLCRANVAILSQKISLLDALVARHGEARAPTIYTTPCPIVGATLGQHIRHSMDHLELAALVAVSAAHVHPNSNTSSSSPPKASAVELYYDKRVRGGTLEKDMDEARKRIVAVSEELLNLAEKTAKGTIHNDIVNIPVKAHFVLSSSNRDEHNDVDDDDDDETTKMGLTSTIGRELGFAAHHAIHHMALIKIIATQSAGLSADHDLPADFGRAPSTVQHDRSIPQ